MSSILGVLLLSVGFAGTAYAQEGTSPTKSVAILPPAEQPELEVTSTLQEPSGNDTLEANEQGLLSLEVTNQGGGSAEQVEVWVTPKESADGIRLKDSDLNLKSDGVKVAEISSLAASTSKSFSIPVSAQRTPTGKAIPFSVDVTEGRGFDIEEPHTFAINTEEYRSPRITIAGFNVKGMSEQKIRSDSANSVSLRVENTGAGPARNPQAKVKVLDGGGLSSRMDGQMNLGTIEPGASTTMTVELRPKTDAEAVPIAVSFRTPDGRYTTNEKLTLPVSVPDRPPLVDRQIPEGDTTRGDAIAVVVGVRNYQSASVPNVDYAARDAETVKKYLTKTMGFRQGNVIELINPTKAEMAAVFGTGQNHKGQLHDYLKTDSTEVFVFYSGHGAPNPEENGRTYFMPSNGSPSQLSITGYPVNQLYENLSKLTSGPVTVAVDACFSGQTEGGALVKNASPAMLKVENPMVGMKNGMVLTASKADQISSWYPEKKHGLFTYFLLKGMRGEADQNDDGLLTGMEMKKYLSENVSYYARRLHSRTQIPQVMGQGADRVLVRYASASNSNNASGSGGASGTDPSDSSNGSSKSSPESGSSSGSSSSSGTAPTNSASDSEQSSGLR